MSRPLKHHFIPVFYLKRWATLDSKLVQFSKPYGTAVKPKRVHPEGTGYIHKLYAIEGVAEDVAYEIEQQFLSPVDSQAAEALYTMLEGGVPNSKRIAWSKFIATLLSRMPEDIRLFKQNLDEFYSVIIPALRPAFEAHKPASEVRTFEELSEAFVSSAKPRAMAYIMRLMSNERLIAAIDAMEWSILSTDGARHEFLTSDRPVVYTYSFGAPDSHLVLPVSPNRLFVAARERHIIEAIKRFGPDRIVEATNIAVTGAADSLVFGSTDRQLRFVQNRMSTAKQPTFADRMLEIQRSTYSDLIKGFEQIESTSAR